MAKMISIKWKLAFYFSIFIIVILLIIFYFMNYLFTRYSASELGKRGLTIGKSFVTYGTTPILGDNMDALVGLMNDLIRLDPDVMYIFVELPRKRFIFHNFSDGLPEVLIPRRVLLSYQENEYSFIEMEETGIQEVSLPILGNLGVVRVGMSDKRIVQDLRKSQIVMMGIMVLALITGLLLVIIFARRLTRPLIRLSEVANRISIGDLDTEVIKVRSRDEVGVLAESIERMQSSVRIAIARLRQRP